MSAKKPKNPSTQLKTSDGVNAPSSPKPIPNWLKHLAWLTIILTGIVLSLKSLTEPDTWWQLRTGEWIVKNGKVPTHDIFSYTLQGAPWINVKWLYEVLIYFIEKIGGPEFVLVLQAIVTVIILFTIRKLYNALFEQIYLRKPETTFPSLILAILLSLICISFRINGRPELFSHLFTAIYILLLIKNRFSKANLLWLLVPLQILWTNLHEGYGIGIVILLIFTIASFKEFIFLKFFLKKESSFDWRLLLLLPLAILAMAVNPYGLRMITHPIEIYGQLNANKYTTELVSFSNSNYWTIQAYINVTLFAFALIFFFLNYTAKTESRYLRATKNFGWGYVAFVVAFFVLSLTANRNIPFAVISYCPLLAIGFGHLISAYLKRKRYNTEQENRFIKRSYFLVILLSAFLYVSIISNRFYLWTNTHSTYGLQVDALNNPTGAADFVKANNITGRCFSDYLISSYLMWALRPGFKTFIDLRDLDVFPASFFEKFASIVNDSVEFEKADSQYHFDYIVLYRNQFQSLHTYLLRSHTYDLVYVDPVAAVYLKYEQPFEPIIDKLGFKKGSRDIFSVSQPIKPTGVATILSTLFNPFFSPRDYSEVDFNLEAAKFYFNAGYNQLASQRISEALLKDPDNPEVWDMSGNIILGSLQQAKGDTAQQYIISAENSFQKANSINSKNEQSLKGLGECALVQGNTENAISYFQKCIAINPKNADCWASLADVYEDLSNNDAVNSKQWLDKRLECMKNLNELNPKNPLILVELGYAYYKTGDCNEAMNYINKVKSFNKFPPWHKADLKEVLEHCGATINK